MEAWSSLILSVLLIIGKIYIGFCAGYWIFHRFFVIFPSRKIDKLPSDYNIEYEEVFFQTTDKIRLQGWFLLNKESSITIKGKQAVIVFFPGNAGSLSKFLTGLKELVSHGFTVFTFSYRGFGKSDFRWPTEKGVYRDAEAAVRYLEKEKGLKSEQLIFYGQSLGCAMASRASMHFKSAALILEAGFPSLPEIVKRYSKGVPLSLLTTSRFDTRYHLSRTHCPVLIAHSPEDKAIRLNDIENLFDAAHEPKRKTVINGLHAKGLEVNPLPFLNTITRFINEELNK